MAKENKTQYAILGVLGMGPASGYDIKKIMSKSTNYFWSEGDSSIYPGLNKLHETGCVDFEWANETSGKPKKIYSITDKGKAVLKNWLEKTPELPKERDELILKLFFGEHVLDQTLIEHIKQHRAEYEQRLMHYKELYQQSLALEQTRAIIHRQLTIKAGIQSAEAAIRWCDESLEILGQMT